MDHLNNFHADMYPKKEEKVDLFLWVIRHAKIYLVLPKVELLGHQIVVLALKRALRDMVNCSDFFSETSD